MPNIQFVPPLEPFPNNNTSVGPRWDGTIRTSIGTGQIGQGEGGDISTVSITEYQPRGQTPRIGLHFMPWFSCSGDCYDGISGGHTEVDYVSNSTTQVAKQIDSMLARDISWINADWYGPNHSSSINATVLKVKDELNLRYPSGGGFEFSVAIDGGGLDSCVSSMPGSYANCHCPNGQIVTSATGDCRNAAGANLGSGGCNNVTLNTSIAGGTRDAFTASTDRIVCGFTNEMLYQMKYIKDHYFISPSYKKRKARSSDGSTRPEIQFWSSDNIADGSTHCNSGTTACTVDPDWTGAIAAVRAGATYGNPYFLFRKRDGLTHEESNGAFGWSGCGGDGTVTDGNANGTEPGCAQEHKFYDPANHPATYKTPANNGNQCTAGCTTKNLTDPYALVHLRDTNNKTSGMTSTATSSNAEFTTQPHNDKPNVAGWWAGVNNRLTPWGTSQRKLVFFDDGLGLLSTWNEIGRYWGTGTGTINTSGTAVTWISGDQFLDWSSGSNIVISGSTFGIASVTDATHLTLNTSAGTFVAAPYTVNNGLLLQDTMGQTLNDFDEGHGMEGGVISGLGVTTPTLTGNILNWTASGERSLTWNDFTTKNTIHHFQILGSQDGNVNRKLLVDDIPRTTFSYDASTIGLEPGTWLLSVRAVGQPLLANANSGTVSYLQLPSGGPGSVRHRQMVSA